MQTFKEMSYIQQIIYEAIKEVKYQLTQKMADFTSHKIIQK